MGLKIKIKLSPFQIILLGFAALIFIGTILLILPLSSNSREVTRFSDALFTATSAVCVTGLVVFDTATHWSLFGQIVILLLIQTGGMGIVTVAAAFALASGKKIGLSGRDTMKEAISAPDIGGVMKLTSFLVKRIFLIEFLGALVMLPVFCMDFGVRGIWMAIFHSVSAFCNAGFDLMGSIGEFSSLTSYAAHPLINVTILLLIVIGGIGFVTWEDVSTQKWHIGKYRMQSKVILSMTGVLILLPALYFFFFEFTGMPLGERIAASLFQSITPRTAGFNTVDLTQISEFGSLLLIALMLIGGAPGSTAGGMKTTTIAVLFSCILSVFRKREDAELMKRRIDDGAIKHAITVFLLYLTLFLSSGALIAAIEQLPLRTCLYETASAIGTVGLSLGVTQSIGTASRAILIALMFFGRVGGLTLIYAAVSGKEKVVSLLPQEKITVG